MKIVQSTNHRRSRGLVSACAAASLFLAACGSAGTDSDGWAEEDSAATAEGAARAVQEPASPPGTGSGFGIASASSLWFRWTKGDPIKTLVPYNTHICGLAMVRGELAGNTSVMVLRSGNNWVLRGLNPGRNLLQMDAVCEPLSAFRVNSGRTVSLAGDFTVTMLATNTTRSTAMPARTVPVFTGHVGRFEGHGERARVTLTPTVEFKNGGQEGRHSAFATALSFGLVGNELPVYIPEGEPRTKSADPGGTSLGCTTPFPNCAKPIAPLATSFCYLSSVSGDFNGADEWAQVYPDPANGSWMMAVAANSGNGITARAECVATNQVR